MSPAAAKAGTPLPHEALLVPLLDVAADLLRELEPGDIPAALKPLAGFDRRGLARSAARSQMARALETEKGFRGKVVEQFLQRPEVQAALDAWAPSGASKLVSDAAGRDDLPLLVSALFAARPSGWEFGLGVATEAYERRRQEEDAQDDRKAVETRLANADRARKRAEEARGAMEQQLTRLEAELKEERRLRRAREDDTGREQETIVRQIDQLETGLAQARAAHEAEQDQRRDAEERAEQADRGMRGAIADLRVAEDQLRDAQTAASRAAGLVRAAEARIDELERMVERLQDEVGARDAASGGAPSGAPVALDPDAAVLGNSELRVLDQVSRVAAELARQLDKLTQRVAQNVSQPPPAAAPAPAPVAPAPVAAAPVDAAPVQTAPAAVEPPAVIAPASNAAEMTAQLDVAEAPPLESASAPAPREPAPPEPAPPEPAPLEPAPSDASVSDDIAAGLEDDEPLDAIPVQVPATTRRGRRRASVAMPPGMLDDSIEAAEAMVRTPGLAIVVDGYNVSMAAWPDLSLPQQRDRLCSALNELQLRLRCQVTVVFDGADVEARPLRYPGLRAIFSKAGEEADDVIVRQVAARPLTVPVLVASSDAWVRDHSEAEGARVIAATTLLKVLRR